MGGEKTKPDNLNGIIGVELHENGCVRKYMYIRKRSLRAGKLGLNPKRCFSTHGVNLEEVDG